MKVQAKIKDQVAIIMEDGDLKILNKMKAHGEIIIPLKPLRVILLGIKEMIILETTMDKIMVLEVITIILVMITTIEIGIPIIIIITVILEPKDLKIRVEKEIILLEIIEIIQKILLEEIMKGEILIIEMITIQIILEQMVEELIVGVHNHRIQIKVTITTKIHGVLKTVIMNKKKNPIIIVILVVVGAQNHRMIIN
jgi:hypothetical protein